MDRIAPGIVLAFARQPEAEILIEPACRIEPGECRQLGFASSEIVNVIDGALHHLPADAGAAY